MVAPHKVDIAFGVKSGIEKNRPHMTLYFDRGTTPVDADFNALTTALGHFINSVPTGAASTVGSYLADTLSSASNGVDVKFYAIPTVRGSMGAPVAHKTFTQTAIGSNAIPAEVSLCVSYQRAYGSDVEFAPSTRPRASDRGRFYLGPLAYTNVIAEDGSTKTARPDSGFQQVVTKACHDFLYAEPLAANWVWLQFSHKMWDWDAVTKVWVDDAFDTQRRRGPDPTVKTSVSLP